MNEPVRGEFRVTGEYFAHPNSNSARQMLTGVLAGPGITPTPGEHLADEAGRWVGHTVLPAVIDRADPAKFVIVWDEVPKFDFRAQARNQAAAEAVAASTGRSSWSATTSGPAAEVYDAGSTTPPPLWAAAILDDLTSQGILPPTGSAGSLAPTVVNLPPQIIDLTAGHLSSTDAAQLNVDGERATAVLTGVADVDVPPQALTGPTASLCDLTLQVTRSNGQTYTAQTRLGFRDARRRALIAVLGATLPVRIDRTDPTRVAVDAATFDRQHPYH